MTRTIKNTARLGIETLERRDCMSATLLDGSLSIVGNAANNHIVVVQDDAANDIAVVEDGAIKHFNSSAVKKINVDLREGNDTFDFRLGGEITGFSRTKAIVAKLGLGDDHVTIDTTNPGLGSEPATMTANLKVKVLGNLGTTVMDGKDTLDVRLGHLSMADVSVNANLGNDNDITRVDLEGDLVGDSDVKMNLVWNDGATATQDGNDSFTINFCGDIGMEASLDLTVGGGRGRDVINFGYCGMVDGLLKAHLDGGFEMDDVQANIMLAPDSEGTIDALVQGM